MYILSSTYHLQLLYICGQTIIYLYYEADLLNITPYGGNWNEVKINVLLHNQNYMTNHFFSFFSELKGILIPFCLVLI